MMGTAAKTGTAPLKHLAQIMVSNVDKKAVEGELAVRLCNYVDVYKHDAITDELPFMDATASMEQIARFTLHAGDVLITKDSETAEDIAVSAYVPKDLPGVVCGYHLAMLRPRGPDVDGRYLHWAISSAVVCGQFHASALGITRFGLRHSAIGEIEIPVPSAAQQRSIADYLDRETARIDALIEKKERMLALFKERQARAFADTLGRRGLTFPDDLESDWEAVTLPAGWRVMHLSQTLVQLTNGYVGPTRDILVDEGIRYVQSVHIKGGAIDFGRRPFFVEAAWHYDRPRIHLRAGDVLIVQTGDIGQVAVVPEGFGEASCHALQIARVRPDVLTGEYLGAYLRSPFGYQSLLCRATGALHPHLEAGIRNVPVIVPPKTEQAEILAEVDSDQARAEAVSEKLACEIPLLDERRQALITAAVTGQLGVLEAA